MIYLLTISPTGGGEGDFNPNQTKGGAKWPTGFEKSYFSGTKGRIDLKPGCKFKFVRCLETYVKKLVSLDHEGTLKGPFLSGVP